MIEVRNTTDVAVIGGGPAGAAAALLLARAGLATLVLESSDGKGQRVGETLPPNANRLLQELGVWSAFCDQQHLPSQGVVSVWSGQIPRINDFFVSPNGTGWNLDRRRFDEMLVEESEKAGAIVLGGARITSCRQDGRQEWQLEFDHKGGKHRVLARYLVDASGRTGAPVLAFLPRREVVDRLIGAAKFFRCDDASRYTLVEAVDEGWFYSAGLPQNRLAVMYFTDADIYARRWRSDPAYWSTQIGKAMHTRDRLGNIAIHEEMTIVSAATSRRGRVQGESWISVGDAAQSFDPLSSLGIYKAIDSAMRACDCILNIFAGNHDDSGYQNWSEEIFRNYLRHRAQCYRIHPCSIGSAFWERRQLV